MTIQCEYDSKRKLLIAWAEGVVSYSEIQRHLDAEEAKGYLGLPEVFDCQNASTNLARSEIVSLVRRLVNYAKSKRLGPTAIVAKQPVTFGMARMFEIVCELEGGPPVGVFNNMEEGERWLERFSGTENVGPS
jgi:hypothetical protein